MNHLKQPFVDAVRAYPAFKGLFKQFCEEATKRLNDNAKLPDVAFSVGSDSASSTLQALGRTFDISLRFLLVDSTPWGAIDVSLQEEKKEPLRLFHFFFDDLGNVKATPTGSPGPDSLSSTAFLKTFLDQLVREYSSHVSKVLK